MSVPCSVRAIKKPSVRRSKGCDHQCTASQFGQQHGKNWGGGIDVPHSCLKCLFSSRFLFFKYRGFSKICHFIKCSHFGRNFAGKVDLTQLTNIHWKFQFMQDTFVFFQLLGKVISVSELRFTDPLVSLLSVNELTIKARIVELIFRPNHGGN